MLTWTTLNWMVLAASAVVLIYIGVRSSRIVRDADEAGFLIAGRTLGPFIAASTIVATGFSGWGFMGSPGVAYAFGTIELWCNFLFAPAMVIAVLFFAKFMRERAQEMGSYTIPEYIAHHHGFGRWARALQAVAAIIAIVLLLVFLVGQIKALGLLGAEWLGIPNDLAAVILMSLIIFYTAFGGLAAVAWTDTLMILGMVVATCIIMGQIFGDVGVGDLIDRLKEIDPVLVDPPEAAPYGKFKAASGLLLPYAFMFSAVLPYMCVRFLGMRPGIKYHKVGIYTAIMACIVSLVPIVGLYMRVKVANLPDPDQAMPVYLHTFLHPVVASLITLGILFAMQSTANSLLHTVSSAISYDLRKALFQKGLPPKKALLLNRTAVVALGLLGIAMMVAAPPFFLNFIGILGTGTLQATLIGPVFVATFWRGNAYGAIASMLGGAATAAYLLLFTEAGWIVGPLVGDALAVVLYMAVSVLTFRIQPRFSEVESAKETPAPELLRVNAEG